MTITVDIRPEVQAELARRAAVHGRAIEAEAARLLEHAVHVAAAPVPPHAAPGANSANLMELFEPIRGLLTDEEVDTLFTRNPSTGRPIDLP